MSRPDAEAIARAFHEAYERLAPRFGYETRQESAAPWADVPAENKELMVAVAGELLERKVIEEGVPDEKGSRHDRALLAFDELDNDGRRVGQRFYDEGMVWLANRVLHPFGWAIGVILGETDAVAGLLVHRTTDADGIIVSNVEEVNARRRFHRALFARARGMPPETSDTGAVNACPECGVQKWVRGDQRGCGNPRCSLYKRFPRSED